VTADIIQKSGAWYSFGEERLGQGRENVRIFLKENDDLYVTIKDLVFKHYEIGEAAAESVSEQESEAPVAESATVATGIKAAAAKAGGAAADSGSGGA
jgi:recombination protein RecA